jgi:hypothetical protein
MQGVQGFRREAYKTYAAVTEAEAQRRRFDEIGNPEGLQISMILKQYFRRISAPDG